MNKHQSGGLRAAQKNKAREPGFYVRIGAIGGSASGTGGFYARRDLASSAGKLGGTISRRGPDKLTESQITAIKKVYREPVKPKSLLEKVRGVIHV